MLHFTLQNIVPDVYCFSLKSGKRRGWLASEVGWAENQENQKIRGKKNVWFNVK